MARWNQPKRQEQMNNSIESINVDELLAKINGMTATADEGKSAPQVVKTEEPEIDSSDTKVLREEDYGDAQIAEIRMGRQQGLDVQRFADPEYNWMQMREIRYGLAQGLDVSYYCDPLFSASQMREIRFGLESSLDVATYARLILSTTDMNRKRKTLFAESYKADPQQYGKTVIDDSTGVQVRISDDCMSAYIQIPKEPLSEITEAKIISILEERNVVYGLQEDAIREAVRKNLTQAEICVALGKKPIQGKDGWYETKFDGFMDKFQLLQPDEEIDYSDVSTVESVVPGQVLVEYHRAQTDVSGMTVSGIAVDGVAGKELPELRGVGFSYNPERRVYLSTEKGYPAYNETNGTLNVWNVYSVRGDVAYYQSVEYEGTVHIFGNVGSMATVRASGSIIVEGFVEGASLFSEHDIFIKGGVNAGGQGIISAGGSLRGKFFENANLRAKGAVEGNYFLNCDVATDDRVTAHGRKARIMGGHITAAISVEAATIGNYMGMRTVFNVGDIEGLDGRIQEVKKSMDTVKEQLDQLQVGKKQLLTMLGDDEASSNALYVRTLMAMSALEHQLEEKNRELDRLNTIRKRALKAYIKIQAKLQEGVLFIINGTKKIIDQPINHGITLTKEHLQGR